MNIYPNIKPWWLIVLHTMNVKYQCREAKKVEKKLDDKQHIWRISRPWFKYESNARVDSSSIFVHISIGKKTLFLEKEALTSPYACMLCCSSFCIFGLSHALLVVQQKRLGTKETVDALVPHTRGDDFKTVQWRQTLCLYHKRKCKYWPFFL